MGDAERDIFWLGTALQSLMTLGSTQASAKGKDSISQILGETIATMRRIDVSGILLTEVESWSNYFRDNYAENEHIRDADKDKFLSSCNKWIQSLSDVMKERFAHPKEIYDRLAKIDHINLAITQLQTAEHQFVCTSPDKRQIKENVTKAIDKATSEDSILLTGYLDNALVDKLIEALKRGVQIRLIVPLYKVNERDNIRATKKIKTNNGQVKQNDACHARIMIFGDKNALISSADPKTDGLDLHFEAGVWTTNATLIQSCHAFFDMVWEDSTDWNM